MITYYMIQKYCLLLIASLVILLFACRSSKKDIRLKCFRLATSTWINGQMLHDNSENIGSCYVANYNGKNYIVTNYHILTGRSPWDINTSDSGYVRGQTPNLALVWFYDNDGNQVPVRYPLLDANNNRLFLTSRHDSSNLLMDIAFIPIDAIPGKAVIESVKINDSDLYFELPGSSEVLVCGFRGDVDVALSLPNVDTVRTVDDFAYKFHDDYLFAVKTINIGGSSGGPVFYKDKRERYHFAGMVSCETNEPFVIFSRPEMRNIHKPKLVYEFVSAGAIMRALDRLSPSRSRKRP